MYLRLCGSFKSAKNNWVRKSRTVNRKKYMRSAYCHICGRAANLNKVLSPQIGGTYLLTAHLW